jgi:hydroxyacylglutathione hydrolase
MLTIKSIPAFSDNYIWLIQNIDQRCAIVDPGDASPVLEYLTKHKFELEIILITHHHQDHTGGVSDLIRKYPNCKIIGPAKEPIPTLTTQVKEGDTIDLFGNTFLVLDLPGHTLGHIGYVGDGKLFCGDVIFAAGCGRVFEGTFNQMFESINKLAELDLDTEVYCAHEYTLSNVEFALTIEPNNPYLNAYKDEVNRLRDQNLPTLPTTLLQEKRINPFLRCQEETVIQAVLHRTQDTSRIAIFSALREWKNEF